MRVNVDLIVDFLELLWLYFCYFMRIKVNLIVDFLKKLLLYKYVS